MVDIFLIKISFLILSIAFFNKTDISFFRIWFLSISECISPKHFQFIDGLQVEINWLLIRKFSSKSCGNSKKLIIERDLFFLSLI